MEWKMRLASTLVLDDKQEADIIELVQRLNESRKMGEVLTHLLRLASECPEIFEKKNGKYEFGKLLETMEKVGRFPKRQEYMYNINKQLVDIQNKVNENYNLCMDLSTQLKVGERLGLEDKLENEKLAQFIIEKQLKDFKNKIGLNLIGSLTSDKQDKMIQLDERAEAVMEIMIKKYSPLLNEIKSITERKEKLEEEIKELEFRKLQLESNQGETNLNSNSSEIKELLAGLVSVMQQNNNISVQVPVTEVLTEEKKESNIKEIDISPMSLVNEDEEEDGQDIDFSGADFAALNAFFD